MIENVANMPIEKLLGKDNSNQELFYKIPPYQREYAWGKNQWENIFNDIDENDEGYFLGSIICIQNNDGTLDVVDGQQRLTTLSILLNSILNFINLYDENYPEDKILDMGKNEDYATSWSLLRKLLFIKSIKSKLTLSIQNNNDEDYNYLLSKNNLQQNINKPLNYGNRRVSKAYEYFNSRLIDKDENDNPMFTIERIFSFLQKVLSSAIVKMEVKDSNSAFILFESINNRGIPLTPIDLIKNSLIGEMEKVENKKPEDTNNEWQSIIQNIEGYNDQVRFLRHYYHAFQCSKNAKVKINPFTKATKSNIITIYSKHIKKDVRFIFDELISKANIYTIFIHPEKIDSTINVFKYQDKFIDLLRLGVAPSYSLLLYLFSEHQSYNFENILNFLENWFIRRHLTDYPATNKLDQIFLDLINKLCQEKTQDIEKTIVDFLTDAKRFKTDDDFLEILTTSPIYDNNTGATRCLLTKLERSKRTKENKVDFWVMTGSKKPTLVWSIEHIYPQNPALNSDWNTSFTKDDKNIYLHRLGNLTLTCYNSTLSNKSYKEKISIEDKNHKDIGLKSGNVEINIYLKNKTNDKWTKNDIESRGKILSDEIIALLQ